MKTRLQWYEQLVCEANLYGYAFFGWRGDKSIRRTLNSLWHLAGMLAE
jgi:hypothetical protein